MDIISRLKQFMELSNTTSSQFADSAGIPRPTLSQLLNGRNKSNEGAKKVSSDIIRKIHEAYPNLNVMWLLFGDGPMEIDSNIEISKRENSIFSPAQELKIADNEASQQQLDFENFPPDFGSINFEPEKTHETQAKTAAQPIAATSSDQHISSRPLSMTVSKNDNCKRVESIMVFYSDNSFEIFKPAQQ